MRVDDGQEQREVGGRAHRVPPPMSFPSVSHSSTGSAFKSDGPQIKSKNGTCTTQRRVEGACAAEPFRSLCADGGSAELDVAPPSGDPSPRPLPTTALWILSLTSTYPYNRTGGNHSPPGPPSSRRGCRLCGRQVAAGGHVRRRELVGQSRWAEERPARRHSRTHRRLGRNRDPFAVISEE